MTDTEVVTARGLNKSFGGRPVLNTLNLTLGRGEAVGLLGANGAGKSTLLKLLLGLQPADAGRCALFGEPSSALSPAARARIAYVPQNPGQFPWLSGQAMLAQRRIRELHLSTVTIVLTVSIGTATVVFGGPIGGRSSMVGIAMMLIPPALALAVFRLAPLRFPLNVDPRALKAAHL